MTSSFFDVQRRQQQCTAVWLIVEVLLLTAVGYLVTVPWQFWQSCGVPDTDGCVPLTFQWGLTAQILVVVLFYLSLALVVARKRAYPSEGREPSTAQHERRLHSIIEQMALASGQTPPRVVVIDDRALNAYATTDRGDGVIAVTSGLLATLDNRELTGVIAHEMSHLEHRDARVIWVATFGVGLIMVLATMATLVTVSATQTSQRSSDDDDQGNGAGLAMVSLAFALVLWLFAFPAAVVMRATISRRREQLADASAVQYTRDPTGLRMALEKMARSTASPGSVRLSNTSLWISDPLYKPRLPRWVRRLTDTHPPIERRIAWLRSLENANALWADFA